MSLVVVLGAGFSKAVSPHFPLTGALGDQVVERIEATGRTVQRPQSYRLGRFETWLSRLAETQPDLGDAENLHNAALFSEMTRAIYEIITGAQGVAEDEGLPWWTYRLIGCLHFAEATVLTFNYDTLFERALSSSGLSGEGSDGSETRVTVDSALRDMPTRAEPPKSGITFGVPRSRTLRLIKLHGSIDTYWVKGDATGSTIQRWEGTAAKRQEVLPGREPFIVPPSATKAPFYRNPLTRQLWMDASTALRNASRVGLIGYSFPETDLVTTGMFGEQLAETASTITVVNPYPSGPLTTLQNLGIRGDRLDSVDDVSTYVSMLEAELPRPSFPDVQDVDLERLPVRISRGQVRPLRTRALAKCGEETVISAANKDQTADLGPTAAQLRDALSTSPGRLSIEFPDGKSAPVAKVSLNRRKPPEILLHPTAIPSTLRTL